MDGTLIDSEPYWIAAELDLTARHGATWTHEDGLSLIGKPLDVSAQILIDRGVNLTVDEVVSDLLNAVAARVRGHVPWQDDARALLDAVVAANIRCALVTMSYGPMTEAFLDAAPGVFEVVVTGDQVANGKPDPEAYLTAAARLGVDITQCVAIEDSPGGTRSAYDSGAATIAVRRLASLEPMPGLTRVRSLDGLTVADLSEILAGDVRDELGRST
jgi:beta-phosphoglucomutase-like phosphatase (HAD superfamily)